VDRRATIEPYRQRRGLQLNPLDRLPLPEPPGFIAATLPLGSVMYEPTINLRGERWIWVEKAAVDQLRALRGNGEDFSDTILRLVAIETKGASSGQPTQTKGLRLARVVQRKPRMQEPPTAWRVLWTLKRFAASARGDDNGKPALLCPNAQRWAFRASGGEAM
jgi:hypothetical protein